jgi:uncharacterized protein YfaS (alpha-2-macroglobulin family)
MNRFVVALMLVLGLIFIFNVNTRAVVPPSLLMVDEPGMEARIEGSFLALSFLAQNKGGDSITASGKFQVLDLDGKSYGLTDRIFAVKGGGQQRVQVRIPFKGDLKSNPGFYNINYQILSQGKTKAGVRSLLPLMNPVSIRVLGGNRFAPGQQAGMRVMVFKTGSGIAVTGATVRGQLLTKDKPIELFQGQTTEGGTLPVSFKIPPVPAGSYNIAVSSELSGSKQQVSAGIEIQPMYKIFIVTDKPIYQPSQTIHFRAITLSAVDQAPAVTQSFTWEVYDPKGNRMFKKELKTDRFGVAFEDFDLADEVNLGTYKIRGTIRNGSFEQYTEKDVTVSRYVLPKFKVDVKTIKNFYLPGDQVKGEVTANYFFGKAVDGTVDITASKFDIGFTDIFSRTLTLRDGKASFEFALPTSFQGTPLEQGNAFVEIKAHVQDSASQEQETTAKLTVTADPIVVAALPASMKWIQGVENRLLVVTQYPDGTPAKTQVSFADLKVSTNDSGVAVLKFVPRGAGDNMIRVRDAEGKSASKVLQFDTADQGVLLTPSKGFYKAGETLNLDIFSNMSKTVYVDLIKNNQTLKTEAIDVTNNKAASRIDLSADFVGSVLVNAYAISRDGETYRDSKWIVVEPAGDLNIEVKPDQTQYHPGDRGTLRFHVTDQNRRGVAAALGVAMVDEAVFALSELRPGLEKVYFLLEEELQKPKYEIHALSIEPLMIEPVREVDQAKAEAALATADRDFHYQVNLNSYEDTAKDFVSKFQQQFAGKYSNRFQVFSEALNQYYQRYQNYPRSTTAVKELMAKRFLKPEDAMDPWGQPFILASGQDTAMPWNFTLVSKGPDEVEGTSDDIPIQRNVWRMGMEDRAGGPMEMPMMAEAKVMQAPVPPQPAVANEPASGVAEPRVREYFPETLLFKPNVITDAAGNAILDVPMADSITDWRVSITASSESGALGSTTASVRVFQDFFVDLDLPVALTMGDEVSVPVAVYNYLPQAQDVRLELQQSAWFSAVESASMTVSVKPNEVASAFFRIRADHLGKQKLTVKAYGAKLSDAVQRQLIVEPNGKKFEDTVSGRLTPSVMQSIVIPAEAIGESRQLLLKIYPGIFNQLLEGLDSILQMPSGCFEQTSSSTYPNVLAMQYMKRTGKITPEIQMKAEGFINLGYQRLVTFEVNGGGFSWFGSPPANKILTAYGLMEFADMSRVYEVDPNLISRTAQWLASQQQPDGSWTPDTNFINEGATNQFNTDLVRIASYLGWALARAGGQQDAVDRAADFVRKNFGKMEDPYGLAVAANFLTERDPHDPASHQILAKLFAMKVEDTDTIYWKQVQPTAVYSEGPSANVETTALATLAYLKDAEYAGAVSKMLTYLVKQKDPRGTWYSTQATIWALRAFIESLSDRREPANATVAVVLNGKTQKPVTINDANSEVMQLINISDSLISGPNQLELKMTGKAQALFSLVARYAMLWKEEPGNQPLDITVTYDKTTLEVNDTATASVSIRNNLRADAQMVIVDLGIPPGFRIATDDLDALVEKKVIEKYSLTGRQAILYFEKLEAGKTVQFSYRLTAKFPIKGTTPAARVYSYYNPQQSDTAAPVPILVRPQK